ncbi:Aromatic-ring hydroxylase-like protein [Niveomyces insectorum RCEF 264]|uniref:Aromatic-ring hydroxylase-like protein n=1 Tax=Niveomyces insectorum RCEF 264 TaxID=1081102 RepID=A0A167P267_9HYPO|nr:Aromatic-ring hydroxylase-like protein [Niveomyces insectorum RCEF 264]
MAATTSKPKTGIRVVVVGTGFAGLTAAIECHRQGHTVTVLEKFVARKELGDIISFGQNSSRIFRRWPGVADKLEPLSHRAAALTMRTWDGHPLLRQTWDQEARDWGVRYDGHRGEFHRVLFEHARDDLGIDIRLGKRVVAYDETADGAAVTVVNTEDRSKAKDKGEGEDDDDGSSSLTRTRIEADVVLAADGVRSLGRTLVLGHEDAPQASGYAVYRAWFDGSAIAQDPLTSFFYNNPEGDQHVLWIGPDVHFIAASLKKGSFSWVCTHKVGFSVALPPPFSSLPGCSSSNPLQDVADIDESWQLEAPVADARKVVAGWEPVVQRILDLTPEPLIDWKLVYRDPLPTWISPQRRIALIGDAAHPFLPTSIQGASQAVEDGVTLGVALRRAGSAANVPEAVAAFEALRYERVRAAQKTGETTRDTWHKADMDAIRANPESMRLKREGWVLGHDAEAYAEEHYDATVAVLRRTGLHDLTEARKLNVPKIDDA